MEAKLREGSIRGMARLLFSSDVNSHTLAGLTRRSHPAPGNDLTFPEAPDGNTIYLIIITKDVYSAVCSFRSGKAGGLEALTSQHLKYLRSPSAGEPCVTLLKELIALLNLMLSGNVEDTKIDILYGAN